MKKTDLKINIGYSKGTFSFYADKSDTIKDLKIQIQEKKGIPIDRQTLLKDFILLEDNSKISKYNIEENQTLRLIIHGEGESLYEKSESGSLCDFKEIQYFSEALKNQVSKKFNRLLYDARRYGDDANTFHKLCDNQGSLFYAIRTTTDAIFGIYVSQPISSDGGSKTDSLQMVISPSHNFAVKSKNSNATYHCQSNQGALFHCMQINTPFLSTNCTDIQSCDDYDLPCYPSGNSSYKIKELQVYALENL